MRPTKAVPDRAMVDYVLAACEKSRAQGFDAPVLSAKEVTALENEILALRERVAWLEAELMLRGPAMDILADLVKETRVVAANIREEFPYLAGNLDQVLKPFEVTR